MNGTNVLTEHRPEYKKQPDQQVDIQIEVEVVQTDATTVMEINSLQNRCKTTQKWKIPASRCHQYTTGMEHSLYYNNVQETQQSR